jgi:hypothetical protein
MQILPRAIALATITFALASSISAQSYDPYGDQWDPIYDQNPPDSPAEPYGVTDGNPLAGTTQAATEASTSSFETEVEQVAAADDIEAATQTTSISQLSAIGSEIGTGSYDIDGLKADFYTLRIPVEFTLSPRDKLNLTIPVSITNYNDVLAKMDDVGDIELSDAQVYGYGFNLAWTRKVLTKENGGDWRWNLTPSLGIFFRESDDMNMGSHIINFGLSSSLAYQFAEGWIVNFGNSFSYATSGALEDYPDPIRDEQQLTVNGIQVIHPWGRWTFSAYIMDTRYFKTENTCVDSFQTYAVSAAFRITQKRSVKVTLLTEQGDKFSSTRATLGSTWQF